ncbi:DUF4351 domain-containing protein [Nostoc sp. UIC 10890]
MDKLCKGVAISRLYISFSPKGRQSELRLVIRLLTSRLGSINSQLESRLQELSLTQLEDLGEVLLDFASEADLMNWLNTIES